jgi:hypothetical protein
MAEKKKSKKPKKKKASAGAKKIKSGNKTRGTGEKRKKISSGRNGSSNRRKSLAGRKIRKLDRSDRNNIFSKTLPDWIISSKSKKNKSGSKKILLLTFFALFVILFFFLRMSLFSPAQDKQTKKNERPPAKKAVTGNLLSKGAEKKALSDRTAKKHLSVIPSGKKAVQERTGPYLVFVIDDVGNTRKDQQLLTELSNNVTYAILPLLPYSEYFANLSKKTGAEVILHLPLESQKGDEKDPGKISPGMSRENILKRIKENLRSVPFCVGANNHKGSLGTSDIRLMRIILSDMKQRGMFFLDSYTTSDSIVSSVSRQLGMPVLRRDVFLDNNESVDKINIQISKLAATARAKGYAIGIGHYKHNTLKVLNKRIPELKKHGFSVISLTRLKNILK